VALAYAPQKDGRCAWSAAHALHSAVLEAQVENTQVGFWALLKGQCMASQGALVATCLRRSHGRLRLVCHRK